MPIDYGRLELLERLRQRTWHQDGIFIVRMLAAMERRGITRQDLFNAGVMSRGLMNKYLKTNTMPTGYMMQRICSAMGVSADYLLGLKDEDVP